MEIARSKKKICIRRKSPTQVEISSGNPYPDKLSITEVREAG